MVPVSAPSALLFEMMEPKACDTVKTVLQQKATQRARSARLPQMRHLRRDGPALPLRSL